MTEHRVEESMYYHQLLRCTDCGVNTSDIGEYYMIDDSTWRIATRKPGQGRKDVLCIGCLEERLGRRVNRTDFNWRAPLNNLHMARSIRLQDRMTTVPSFTESGLRIHKKA